MDIAKDNFAGDPAPDDKVGSAATGASEPGAENKADALQGTTPGNSADASAGSPMHGEVLGPSHAAAPGAGAKARLGSSLILVPPVTRGGEGAEGDQDFSAQPGRSSDDFTAERRSRFARPPFLKDGWKEDWNRYAIPAALGFCLFGVGVATGGQFFGGQASNGQVSGGQVSASQVSGGSAPATAAAQVARRVAIAAPDPAQAKAMQLEMRHLNKRLGDEIHALQARVDALRVAVRAKTPVESSEDLRSMRKGIDSLKASFQNAKTETDASIAVITAKLDHLQHQEARLERPSEKAVRSEKLAGTPATTGSIARGAGVHGTAVASAIAIPPLKGQAQPLGLATETKKKPRLLTNWIVRDVYEGVALVEGPQGSLEVARGESIPGAGRVESIERRGAGWVVLTDRGMVASAMGD